MNKSDRTRSNGHNVAAATPFTRFRAEVDALGDEEFLIVNTDIGLAVSAALEAAPRIFQYRDQILALPGTDPRLIDRLVPLAKAVDHAQSVWVTQSERSIGDALQRGIKIRDRLSHDVAALVSRGLVPTETQNCFSSGISYREVGADLAAVAVNLIARWDEIKGRTSIARSELDEAASLAVVLKNAALNKERPMPAMSQATRDRAAIFTLLVRCYEEIRRALGWIRWYEGDVNQLAPSLYVQATTARRNGRRPTTPPAAAAAPASDAPRDPGTTPPPAATTG